MDITTLVIIALILLYGSWYFAGSIIGRRIMIKVSRGCLEKGFRIKLISPSSILIESSDNIAPHRILKYIGLYIEWLPFENIFIFPIKYLVRRKPLVVIKMQFKKEIKAFADIYVYRDLKDNSEHFYIEKFDLESNKLHSIVALLHGEKLKRIIISERPSVSIITYMDKECGEFLNDVLRLADDIQKVLSADI
ncbi:MAG: hypothetical protein ACP5I7_04230 [Sulfolobales archaeon]|jgi:hypothetical protein